MHLYVPPCSARLEAILSPGRFTIAAPQLPGNGFEEEAAALDRNPRLHRFPGFSSRFLPGEREILVYLPPQSLDEPERRFSVLYLHDGQNLMDPRTSFLAGQTWQADATLDRLSLSGLTEPLILVGIANTGVRRMAEYTPLADPQLGGGEGALYTRLLVEELKPWIDQRFPTLCGPGHTGLGGSSLGGLISLWAGLRAPHIFGRLAVLSPSLWWARRSIFAEVERLRPEPKPRIWMDIGLMEGPRHMRNVQAMERLLRTHGWDPANLHVELAEGGAHTESSWAARLPGVLQFLFPA